MSRRAASLLVLAILSGAARLTLHAEEAVPAAAASAARKVLMPPAPPVHARRSLDAASELAKDLSDVVAYLDAGQAYFRAYQKGSHSAEENRQFLAFLQAYENEYAVAKREGEVLRKWIIEQGSLDAASK